MEAVRRGDVRAVRAERWLLILVVALLPVRAISPIFSSILSIGVLIAIPVLIVPISKLSRYKFGPVLGIAFLGVFLTAPLLWIETGGRQIQWDAAMIAMVTLFTAFVHLVVLLWARRTLGVLLTVGLYATGMIVQVLLTIGHTAGNPWKFGLAVPVTILALVFASGKRPLWTVIVLLAAGGASIANDFRSFLALAIVTLVIWAWNSRSRARASVKLIGFVAVSVLAYVGGTQAALLGLLGERNQLVTQQQIANAGSVLAGGRVESAASFALFAERPVGIGPGVLPLPSDIMTGESALLSRGVNIDGEYVNDYLFAAGIKLHSLVADFWVNYGLVGLALALLMGWIAVTALLRAFSNSKSPALIFFLIVITLWNLAFSPIGTNLWETILAVSVLAPIAYIPQPEKNAMAMSGKMMAHARTTSHV